MPDYLRAYVPGGTFFFTVVTFGRMHFFTDDLARATLRLAWKRVQSERPFDLQALCLLPDHLHCVWVLPEGDSDYSTRWAEIKGLFTRHFCAQGGREGQRNPSRRRRREAAVWQRRFWEHVVRDEEDFEKHVDYIHFNPVKHGYVQRAKDWPWSTFHRYVRDGLYDEDWGEAEPDQIKNFECVGE
ncbi:MAG: transposase [Planctomycetes bacterium]|nr:transposase [Planctomycetota bacterium]